MNFKGKLSFVLLFFTVSFIFPLGVFALGTSKIVPKDNLVAYWQFNESSGTSAKDSSGSNKNGAVYGTPTWSSGKIGSGLYFDGATNHVQTSAITSVTKTGVYSFSAWIKSSTVGTQTIFQSSPSCLDRNGAALSGNLLAFGYYNGTSWVGASGYVPVNHFFHVVGVNNGGVLSLYINGVLQSGTGAPYVHCADTNFYLGIETYGGGQDRFIGTMDDVRVYSKALSASEVIALYKTNAISIKNSDNTNLLGYWPLNENYNDYSGRRNNLTVNGTCLSTTSDSVTGGISITGWSTCGTAPSLQGYLSSGDVFNSTSEFTFTVWAKGTGYLWSGAPTFWFVYDGTTAYLQKYTGSWVTIASAAAGVTSSNWNQFVITKNSSGGVKIYSNGLEIASSTTQNFYTPTSQTIGRYAVYDDGSYHFTGKIDDVRLYGRVLSLSEIKELYKIKPASVAPSKTKVSTSLGGPSAYYTFDGKDINWLTGKAVDKGTNSSSTVLNGMSLSTSPSLGKIGQALNFDGVNDYIDTGNTNTANGNMTISMWLKPRVAAGYVATQGVINSGIRYGMYFSGNKINWSCYNGGYFTVTTDNVIPTDKWTHIVGTIAAGQTGGLKIYVNGTLQSSSSTIADCGSYGSLYIGSYIWPIGTYYSGLMDDFRVYTRTLSAAEVLKLYQLGGR